MIRLIPLMVFVLVVHTTARAQGLTGKKSQITSRAVIRVLDSETLRPVNADILVTGSGPGSEAIPLLDGQKYNYKVCALDTVTFWIQAPGYEASSKVVALATMNGIEVFYLRPRHRDGTQSQEIAKRLSGTPQNILNDELTSVLYFEQSDAEMLERSQEVLDHLLEFLQKNDVAHIELEAHTDNVGTPEKNMLLSIERAGVIRRRLLQVGIDPVKISSRSYGGVKPAAPNDSERNKRFNRRVEIRLATAN